MVMEYTPKNERIWKSRPLNAPESFFVKENSKGAPIRVGPGGKRTVIAIADKWRIDDEWWRKEPISRTYYAVILDNGARTVVFKDLISGSWYKQRY